MHVDHASSELRWGDARVALCLQRQLDIFTERHGRWRGRALMAVRLAGAGLRTVYYSWRARLSGPSARPYREMEPHVRATFRALAALAFGRG
jgi:hypothetical protein